MSGPVPVYSAVSLCGLPACTPPLKKVTVLSVWFSTMATWLKPLPEIVESETKVWSFTTPFSL